MGVGTAEETQWQQKARNEDTDTGHKGGNCDPHGPSCCLLPIYLWLFFDALILKVTSTGKKPGFQSQLCYKERLFPPSVWLL